LNFWKIKLMKNRRQKRKYKERGQNLLVLNNITRRRSKPLTRQKITLKVKKTYRQIKMKY
jgi:hypothetical protein